MFIKQDLNTNTQFPVHVKTQSIDAESTLSNGIDKGGTHGAGAVLLCAKRHSSQIKVMNLGDRSANPMQPGCFSSRVSKSLSPTMVGSLGVKRREHLSGNS